MPFSSNAHHLLLLKSYYWYHLLDKNGYSRALQICCANWLMRLILLRLVVLGSAGVAIKEAYGWSPDLYTTDRPSAYSATNLLGWWQPPDFGRSVNTISTRGDRLCPPNYYWHLRIFIPCDGPACYIASAL